MQLIPKSTLLYIYKCVCVCVCVCVVVLFLRSHFKIFFGFVSDFIKIHSFGISFFKK